MSYNKPSRSAAADLELVDLQRAHDLRRIAIPPANTGARSAPSPGNRSSTCLASAMSRSPSRGAAGTPSRRDRADHDVARRARCPTTRSLDSSRGGEAAATGRSSRRTASRARSALVTDLPPRNSRPSRQPIEALEVLARSLADDQLGAAAADVEHEVRAGGPVVRHTEVDVPPRFRR